MHDIKSIRDDQAAFDAALARRALPPCAAELVAVDDERRAAVARLQTMQADRNALAKRIGEARRAKVDTGALEQQGAAIRAQMESLEQAVPVFEATVRDRLASLPNILDADVADGRDEADNVCEKTVGALRNFAFTPKQHFELFETTGWMDFAAGAKLAGARFTVLRGPLARLERALGQFMLDLHTGQHGYTEISAPLLVNDAAMFGTGQLPKFADDLFRTTDGRWLIPTAEVSLTNLVQNEILAAGDLPLRMTALTPCFRSEAGAAGRDVRGMLRQHQFAKVELVSITTPEQSDAEHERMTQAAETVLEQLELPYRRMRLCAGDTGFSAAKTYDLEVFLPGQNAYREISSCSNMRGFQARRMHARYRPAGGGIAHVNTLNGSGVAIGRALIAVLETHQTPAGGVTIPAALRPYFGADEIPPPV
jgi:seryl-tRNA synthetase